MSAAVMLEPRDRPEPVTHWRREVAHMADEIAKTIFAYDDPENQYRHACDIAQDIVHVVTLKLRQQYGKTFDPLLDKLAS